MRKYLETHGFKFNPYDPCVDNKITKGEPLTVVFHINYLNASNKGKKMVENIEQWIELMYGEQNIGKVKSV